MYTTASFPEFPSRTRSPGLTPPHIHHKGSVSCESPALGTGFHSVYVTSLHVARCNFQCDSSSEGDKECGLFMALGVIAFSFFLRQLQID